MADNPPEAESQNTPAISNSQSFLKAVHARFSEYVRRQKIKVKIGSWNTAKRPDVENDLGAWFVLGNKSSNQTLESEIENQCRTESVYLHRDENELKGNMCLDNSIEESQPENDISLYVLGLQETVKAKTAKQYIGSIYSDPEPLARWRKVLQNIMPSNYVQILEQQSSGLLLFIYASPSIAPKISYVSTVTVGTGIMGYLGNKGAIVARIVLEETTRLVFINSHLAPGVDQQRFERRCWDVSQILQRTKFEPVKSAEFLKDSPEQIGDEEIAFWFGDLNFRLAGIPGDEIRRLLMLSTGGKYNGGKNTKQIVEDDLREDGTFIIRSDSDDDDDEDKDESSTGSRIQKDDKHEDRSSLRSRIHQGEKEKDENSAGSRIYKKDTMQGNIISSMPLEQDDFVLDPSQDPSSLQSILNCLLPHDQLKYAQTNNKAFHDGWREGPISFLPTYKYDIGSDLSFDTSEKNRAPSWCDRILYRTRQDRLEFEEKLKKTQDLNKKNSTLQAIETIKDNTFLFDYNPLEDYHVENDNSTYEQIRDGASSETGTEEKLDLDTYTSHQQINSSDHKPIHATFTLTYNVVLPEIKAKIQQEVARDLDRAENEGRPGVTIVIDDPVDDPLTNSSQKVAGVIDFGNVAYDDRIIRNLTIANTSRVTATINFLDRLSVAEDNNISVPSWISIFFLDYGLKKDESESRIPIQKVTLAPGDAINAQFELHVQDIELIRALNENSRQLEDILVLRVIDGRDHFIPVRGSWLQTCLGRSISQLIRIPEGGARNISPRSSLSSGILEQDACCSAPRELLKLTETLQSLIERTIADSNILEEAQIPPDAPGWPFDCKYWIFKDSAKRNIYKKLIINALDTDKDLNGEFPPESLAIERLEIVSEVLLLFLSCIQDGIVSSDLWLSLEESYPSRCTSIKETKAWVLDILSVAPNHSVSFVFLTSILSHVITELATASKLSKRLGNISIDTVLRGGISWKTKTPEIDSNDFLLIKRGQVEKAVTEIFLPVVFKDKLGLKERERKSSEEKRKFIFQAFLKGNETVNN